MAGVAAVRASAAMSKMRHSPCHIVPLRAWLVPLALLRVASLLPKYVLTGQCMPRQGVSWPLSLSRIQHLWRQHALPAVAGYNIAVSYLGLMFFTLLFILSSFMCLHEAFSRKRVSLAHQSSAPKLSSSSEDTISRAFRLLPQPPSCWLYTLPSITA